MSSRLCPRCEHALPFELDGALVYCPACGAPQVRVSEQLLDEIQQRRHNEQQDATVSKSPELPPAGRKLLQTAALTGGVAAGLALFSFLLPPAVLLLWFWVVGAPVVALGMFVARQKGSAAERGLSAGLGARLGFLSGLAVLLALGVVNTASLLLVRFGLHKTAMIDGRLAVLFAQMRVSAEAQYGSAMAAPFLGLLSIPEFRAGLLLSSLLMVTAGYLLLATLGGAFAGLLRRGSGSQT